MGSDPQRRATLRLEEIGDVENLLGQIGQALSSGELEQLLRQSTTQGALDKAFVPFAGELAQDARNQASVFETPEANANLAALLRGEVPEQQLQQINKIAEGSQARISGFEAAGLRNIRGATEASGLRTGDQPIQNQFGQLGAEVLRQRVGVEQQRAQQLLTFPQQQAQFQQGLRQQAFANRAGLLQGGAQLGLGLSSILGGTTSSFLDLTQRPRLIQTTGTGTDVVGGFEKAGDVLGGIGSILG